MTLDGTQNNIDSLSTLLETERTALLAGDLAALGDLLPEKEMLITALNADRALDRPELKTLGEQVRRNQLLLDSALDGIREVSNRMSALQKMRSGLATYGSDGLKHDIKVHTDHSVERRA